jgi:hypothetical protein
VISTMVTVACDGCAVELAEPGTAAPQRFGDGNAAMWAAQQSHWIQRLSGRLLCTECADRQRCRSFGHDYGGPGSWRMCACERSIPSHAETDPDPAGGDGCGMQWRLCGRCDRIDERHVIDAPRYPTSRDRDAREVQPGDGFLAEVAAGLGLPNHQQANGETAMVEPTTTPGSTRGGAS